MEHWTLKEVNPGHEWHVLQAGAAEPAFRLVGGTATLIAALWRELADPTPEFGSTYLQGVLDGLRHFQVWRLTGQHVWLVGGVADVYADGHRAWAVAQQHVPVLSVARAEIR